MPSSRLALSAVIDGTGVSPGTTLSFAKAAEALGMHGLWLPQMPNQMEVGTMLPALAAATERMTIGSAVMPMYTRPPVVMAQSALTADALSGGRTALGLGLGHRGVGDWMVGSKPPPAVPATREYLSIVTALTREGEVSFTGEWHSGHASYAGERREDFPVYMGTFGPRMLELAGELADGVILWMCTTDYLVNRAVPALRRGWARRGCRPDGFRIVVMMHAGLTGEPEADRGEFARLLTSYLRVDTYRRLFTSSGFAGAVEAGRPDQQIVRALGAFTPEEVTGRLMEYRQAGADEVAVVAAGRAQHSYELCMRTLADVGEMTDGI